MPLRRREFYLTSGIGLRRPGFLVGPALAITGSSTVASSTDGNSVTTTAVKTLGANLIVVSAAWTGTTPTLSDSATNTWTSGTVRTLNTTSGQLFWTLSPITSSAHTFTFTGTANKPAIAVAAFTLKASTIIQGGTTTTGTSIGRTPSGSGSSNLVAVGGLAYNDTTVAATGSIAANSVVTSQGFVSAAATANALGVGIIWETTASTSASAYSWTWSVSGDATTPLTTFQG